VSYGAGTTRFATEVYHPNVSSIGEINLDILGKKWTPDYDVAAVLKSLHAPLPNPDLTRPANLDATLQFRKNPGSCLAVVQQRCPGVAGQGGAVGHRAGVGFRTSWSWRVGFRPCAPGVRMIHALGVSGEWRRRLDRMLPPFYCEFCAEVASVLVKSQDRTRREGA
jgi:hypothetical protein